MALNGKDLGDGIANIIIAADAPADVKAGIMKMWEDIGTSICDYILKNIEIKIPSGSVITAVSGGSGAPAVGTPNVGPIDCSVS